MTIMQLDICGPSYSLPSSQVTANQASINMYPIFSSPTNSLQSSNPLYQGRGKATMLPTAGFQYLGGPYTAGSTGARHNGCCGMYLQNVLPSPTNSFTLLTYYAVIHGQLVKISVTLTYSTIINPATDFVVVPVADLVLDGGGIDNYPATALFSSNATQLYISWGTQAYVYNLSTNAVTLMGNPPFAGNRVAAAVNIDGYFFAAAQGTNQFYSSSINDGTTWNAANTAQMQSRPDKLITLNQNKGELWGFGTNHIEVWFDAANNTGMPFSKRVGSDIGIGTISPYSVIVVNDSLYWIDRDM
jgi:hypothetical protein